MKNSPSLPSKKPATSAYIMLGTRSLIGLTLSLLVHAGAVAFFVTQDEIKEKPKPKIITLQMAMFKSEPVKKPQPIIEKPVEVIPSVVTPPPVVPTPVVTPPKPKPVEKLKPVIKKKPKPKPKKKRLVKKKKKIKKVVKKPIVKLRKVIPKRKVVLRKPRPVVRKTPPPVRHKPPARRVTPTPPRQAPVVKQAPRRVVKPVRKAPVRVVKPAVVAKTRKPQQGNPQLESQYGKGIFAMVNQKKSYPHRAKRRRIQGVVKVAFNITKNGTVSNLRIYQSSGSSVLDSAALKAVKKVGRFPAIPASINKQVLSYIIPISYRLR